MKIKESVTHTIFLGILLNLTNGILAFFIHRLFSDSLGQENLGVLKLYTQLLSYLSLSELGLSSAAIMLLYEPLVKGEQTVVKKIFYSIDKIYKIIITVSTMIGLCMLLFINAFLDYHGGENIQVIWVIYVIGTTFTYLTAKYSIVLTANQMYRSVQLKRNLVKILISIVQVGILLSDLDNKFIVFSAIIILGVVLEYAYFKFGFFERFPYLKFKGGEFSLEVIQKTKKVFVHKIGGVLVFSTDYLLITKFVSLNAVAVYATYQLLTQFIMVFVNVVAQSLKPGVGVKKVYASNLVMYEGWKSYFIVACSVASVAINAFFLTVNDFIILWMGSDYLLPYLTVYILAVNFATLIIRIPLEIFKEAYGNFDDINLPIIEGIINLILSVFLGYYWGLNGVLVGTLISNFIIVLYFKPKFVFEKLFCKNFKEGYINVCISMLAMVFLSHGINLVCSSYFIQDNMPFYFKLPLILMLSIIMSLLYLSLMHKNFLLSFGKHLVGRA